MTRPQPILSIIIAAYNVEYTLDRIFDKLLACPAIGRFEVIVVNDGSHDGTSQLAHEYANAHPGWVSVIDKPNGGHGSALSAGFQKACGMFCRPLDGDDWLDPQGLAELIEFLGTTSADMVVTDHCLLNLDTDASKTVGVAMQPNTALTVADLARVNPLPGYHDIIFATSIVQNIPQLDHHCFYVDNEYDVYPLFAVHEVRYLPVTVYVHTIGNDEQSTSNESLIRNRGNLRTVFLSLMDYASEHADNTAAVAIAERYARGVLYLFTRVALDIDYREGSCELREFYEQIATRYPSFYRSDLGTAGNVYKRMGRHGYGLVRLLVLWRYRNNRSIIWAH